MKENNIIKKKILNLLFGLLSLSIFGKMIKRICIKKTNFAKQQVVGAMVEKEHAQRKPISFINYLLHKRN
jgi:hypothetical protein